MKVRINFKIEDDKKVACRPTVQDIRTFYNPEKVLTHTGDVFIVAKHEGTLDGVNYEYLATV